MDMMSIEPDAIDRFIDSVVQARSMKLERPNFENDHIIDAYFMQTPERQRELTKLYYSQVSRMQTVCESLGYSLRKAQLSWSQGIFMIVFKIDMNVKHIHPKIDRTYGIEIFLSEAALLKDEGDFDLEKTIAQIGKGCLKMWKANFDLIEID
jgi:hypothetical protein